ncbi:MAG: ABC transporter substrate-binding protein [bacterium]|nr:ABC transporter substrate-binding protein [bacterium]
MRHRLLQFLEVLCNYGRSFVVQKQYLHTLTIFATFYAVIRITTVCLMEYKEMKVTKLLTFVFLLLAFTVPTMAQEPARLVFGTTDEPDLLDIQQATGTNFTTSDFLTQPLVFYSLESADVLVPDLATSYSFSEDGLKLTFNLPAGYVFSNGDPLDADAVRASIERYRTTSPYPEDWGDLLEMNVLNDSTTLEMIYEAPPAFMSPVLSSGFGAPFNTGVAEEVGNEAFGANPVASGPFVLESWTRGTEMRLVRNENYRTNLPFVNNKGPVLIDEIVTRFIPDPFTLIAELEAGNLDIVYGVPSSAVASLQSNPEIEVTELPTAGLQALFFNTAQAPFNDLSFRQALAAAINRDVLVQVLEGTVVPQYAFIAEAMVSYDPEVYAYGQEQLAYNPDAARQILNDAGYVDSDGDGIVEKDGSAVSIELLIATDDAKQMAVGVVLQAMLQEVGIEITITQFEQSFIYDRLANRDYGLAIAGYVWWDPDIMLYRFTDAGSNWSGYDNADVTRLLNEGRTVVDPAARRAIYSEAQRLLIDDVAAIPLWTESTYIANRTWVDGLIIHPITTHMFVNDVTLSR